ncbi:hypothetical protein V6N13_024020 [Hibiscus sabdariffa]|uniref:Uncharacterized protein n=1 Tax=Hibiscus sabdariffa TaxID=183260 RepID=A0ABR2PNG8_9ROSI
MIGWFASSESSPSVVGVGAEFLVEISTSEIEGVEVSSKFEPEQSDQAVEEAADSESRRQKRSRVKFQKKSTSGQKSTLTSAGQRSMAAVNDQRRRSTAAGRVNPVRSELTVLIRFRYSGPFHWFSPSRVD